MKPQMAFAWFLVSVALAALLVVQWRKASDFKVKTETLQLEIEKLDRAAKVATAQAEESRKEQGELRSQVRELEASLAQANQAATSAPKTATTPASRPPGTGESPGDKGPMDFLKGMLENPEMAGMIKEQQKMAVNMMYGGLATELGLSEDEAKQLKDILLERQMMNVTNASALMSKDVEERKAAAEKVQANNKEFEDKIKSLLGDQSYEKYQDYNTTIGERMALSMFQQQANLGQDQQNQLLDIIKEEKKAMLAANPDIPKDPNTDVQKAFEAGMIDKMLSQQEQVNAKVLERAQAVLNPVQLEQYAEFQKNQLNMQKFGIEMMKNSQQGNAQPPDSPVPQK